MLKNILSKRHHTKILIQKKIYIKLITSPSEKVDSGHYVGDEVRISKTNLIIDIQT